MNTLPHSAGRRTALRCAAALVLARTAAAWAQPGKPAGHPVTVAQIVDMSPEQRDVSKDFLIGSRAAWQHINSRGGIKGRPVVHQSLEVDASPASVRAAVAAARDNPNCLVLSGSAGDPAATAVVNLLRQDNAAIAHVAPWLQNSSVDVDDRTFPIFAARQEQIAHAIRSLALVGMQEIGAVYASNREYALYREDLERTAAALTVRLQSFRAEGDLDRLGQRLTGQSAAVLLFIGGTPELVQFTQGLERQSRQRYVVALADVNLQTMMQMGAARSTPVIATQAVPMVNDSMPIVRAYRDTLARLFDEPPTPLGLAGFIAARYTYEVLNDIDGALTRQGALAAFRRRAPVDLGGFRVTFNRDRRSGAFVTQSMLTVNGRVIG
jgi:ABC-type branched-subunit amino acid transport system substrate-binding protein